MKRRPTLRDVAAATGLHFTTVGLALRDDPRIAPETRDTVRAAASRLGYTRDAMLSALSTYRHATGFRYAGNIAYLHSYDFAEELPHNPREAACFWAAKSQALELGFKLDPIRFDEKRMSAKRLNQMLTARGIRGLILAPMRPVPGPIGELDWSKFAVVAIGYSITNLRSHRTAPHQALSMDLHIAELRRLGYKRIGLVMPHEVNLRTRGLSLGAVMAEQRMLASSAHTEPLVSPQMRPDLRSLQRWLRREKPDCVVVPGLDVYKDLISLGIKIPGEMGVSTMSRDGEEDPVAGIDEQLDLLGTSSVDLLISLLRSNELGLPSFPRYSLVEGRWVWKPTIRAAKRNTRAG